MTISPDRLSAFVRRGAATKFDLTSVNCMLWVADWVRDVVGIDPAFDWRDPASWQERIWNFEVEQVARQTMAAIGLLETQSPLRGDVGVVVTPAGPTAAICLGLRWVALAPAGLAAAVWPVIVAWRTECLRP